MTQVAGYVYLLTNTVNGKRYVGQTITTINRRWSGHVKDANRNKPYPICQAIKKYGKGSFKIEKLAAAQTLDDLNQLEILCIEKLNTRKPLGYNLSAGGLNGRCHPETIAKLTGRKRPHHVGLAVAKANKSRIHTAESRLKMSLTRKGKPKSAETRARMSDAQKGNDKYKQARRGADGRFYCKEEAVSQERLF